MDWWRSPGWGCTSAPGSRRSTDWRGRRRGDACYSPYGRNRAVGEHIGRGETLYDVLGQMVNVAEGVPTTRAFTGSPRSMRGDADHGRAPPGAL